MLLEEINTIDEIFNKYQAIICDIWGVLHNGVDIYRDAIAALRRARANGKYVILLTNAPKRSDIIQGRFKKMGVSDQFWDETVTSGDIIATYLLNNAKDKKIYHWGSNEDKGIYQDYDFTFSDLNKAELIVCTGLEDSLTEVTVDELSRLQACADKKLTMICANPDRSVKVGHEFQLCAGTLADLYIEYGAPVEFFGKPYVSTYNHCFTILESLISKPIHTRDILAIGDGLYTDIKGAENAGLDCLLVLEGLHQPLFACDAYNLFSRVRDVCDEHGVRPDYYIPSLK